MIPQSVKAAPSDYLSQEDMCQERFIHIEHVREVRRTLLPGDEAERIRSCGDP